MQTISGKLIGGVEFEGKVHRKFTLRPLLVRDSLETLEVCKDKDAQYVELVLLARRIVMLGEIPKERITGEMLMDMMDGDLEILFQASIDLQKKILEAANADASDSSDS
jgi:hypothetical protein